MEENKQQEIMYKLASYEQQMRHLQQQAEAVENAIVEMNSLHMGLGEMVGKTEKEILAPVGRGIFANAKLTSEELLVDIGDKNFVKKSIPETQKIILDQVSKLEEAKKDLQKALAKLQEEVENVFAEYEGK